MNLVVNAAFLDGLDAYVGSGGGRTVVQDGMGARGRMVLRSTGTAVRAFGLEFPLQGQTRLQAFAHAAHEDGSPLQGVTLQFFNGAASVQTLQMVRKRRAAGAPRLGLPSTFDFWTVTADVPATADRARIVVNTNNAAPAGLLKPYAGRPLAALPMFQMGPHSNPDLNHPSWPTELPTVMDEGLQFDPIGTRRGFTGDSGIEATSRMTRSRRYRMSGQLALTNEERAVLMAFFDQTPGKFWFTRPDTREVCLAQWLSDGEPVDAGQLPGRRRTQIKLQLSVP